MGRHELVECPALKNALNGVAMTCTQLNGLQGLQRGRNEMAHPSIKTSGLAEMGTMNESCFLPGDTAVSTALRALIALRSGQGPFR